MVFGTPFSKGQSRAGHQNGSLALMEQLKRNHSINAATWNILEADEVYLWWLALGKKQGLHSTLTPVRVVKTIKKTL